MKKTICALLILAAIAGCKNENFKESIGAAQGGATMEAAPVADEYDKADESKPKEFQPKIIRNASLRFEADDLKEAAGNIKAIVAKYKAEVQNDSESKDHYYFNRNITVRVPAKHFEAFLNDIGKGVAYFDRKEISAQDVTEEYVDIEARLKAKKVLEARYLDLIGKAKKVSEILEIEKELSAIREDIEAQEGRLRYMQNSVAMSTISIEVYKRTELEPDATMSYGTKMINALKSGFNALSLFFIGLLYVWPFILTFVIAFIIIRKKLKKRN